MQVLLIKDLINLGRAGESVKVKPGYARNYLLPRKIAVPANEANLKKYSSFIKKMERIREQEIKSAEDLKERLDGLALTFTEKASSEGRLYGSISAARVAEEISSRGFEIDKQQVVIPVRIKEAGEYTARVRIYQGIDAHVKISVTAELEEAAPVELTTVPEASETASAVEADAAVPEEDADRQTEVADAIEKTAAPLQQDELDQADEEKTGQQE